MTLRSSRVFAMTAALLGGIALVALVDLHGRELVHQRRMRSVSTEALRMEWRGLRVLDRAQGEGVVCRPDEFRLRIWSDGGCAGPTVAYRFVQRPGQPMRLQMAAGAFSVLAHDGRRSRGWSTLLDAAHARRIRSATRVWLPLAAVSDRERVSDSPFPADWLAEGCVDGRYVAFGESLGNEDRMRLIRPFLSEVMDPLIASIPKPEPVQPAICL